MIDLVNVPKTVRINEAWEVGYNQIVDFSPYLEGTSDAVSVLDLELVFERIFRTSISNNFPQASISKLIVNQINSILK